MYIYELLLTHFRNFSREKVTFSPYKNFILGDNGHGKTNLLESIYFLGYLESFRTAQDSDLVQLEAVHPTAVAATVMEKDEHFLLELVFSARKKNMKRNGVAISNRSDYLGCLRAVLFSANDLLMVKGDPESRRKYIDHLITSKDPRYDKKLQTYQKVLSQRNALLKYLSEEPGVRPSQLEELSLWDEQLIRASLDIWKERFNVLQKLLPLADGFHQEISGGREHLEVEYQSSVGGVTASLFSSLEEAEFLFRKELKKMRPLELNRGYTILGPHRDDLILKINGHDAKKYGSQGQQRTLAMALKLAELNLVREESGSIPVLLLDDVMAELDPERQKYLVKAIPPDVQTIITTTHLEGFDGSWTDGAATFTIRNGKIANLSK